MFLKKHPLQTIDYLIKSPLSSYYFEWIYINDQGMSVNNFHIFSHNLIFKPYPSSYYLIFLFGFIIIDVDRVAKLDD